MKYTCYKKIVAKMPKKVLRLLHKLYENKYGETFGREYNEKNNPYYRRQ